MEVPPPLLALYSMITLAGFGKHEDPQIEPELAMCKATTLTTVHLFGLNSDDFYGAGEVICNRGPINPFRR